jgi:hypothetical protein
MDPGQLTPLVKCHGGVLHVDQAAVLAAGFSPVVFEPALFPEAP